MYVDAPGFQKFSILKHLNIPKMSLKSDKSVGKVSNSSINIISVSEYSCLLCVNDFTNLDKVDTLDCLPLTFLMTFCMDSHVDCHIESTTQYPNNPVNSLNSNAFKAKIECVLRS
jgi:hypothetical protein